MPIGAIFAGGYGKRLHPLTDDIPKVLIDIGEKQSLMDHTLTSMKRAGLKEIFLLAGHLSHKIRSRYGDHHNGLNMHYLEENKPMGTLWALRNLFENAHDDILLMNGDVVCDLDLSELIDAGEKNETLVTLVSVNMKSPFGVLNISEDGKVIDFMEKPILNIPINGGIYFMKKDVKKYLFLDYEQRNIEPSLFSKLAEEGEISSFMYKGFHKSLEGFKDLEEIRSWFSGSSSKV